MGVGGGGGLVLAGYIETDVVVLFVTIPVVVVAGIVLQHTHDGSMIRVVIVAPDDTNHLGRYAVVVVAAVGLGLLMLELLLLETDPKLKALR